MMALLERMSPDPLDRRYLAEAFAKLPQRWHKPMAGRYVRQRKERGRKAANLAVLDVLDSLAGFRFGVASGEDELRAFAKARADECLRTAGRWKDADAALDAMRQVALRYGIPPPAGRTTTKAGQRARLVCEHWWRRQARTIAGRNVEGAAIGVGLVHRLAGLYASDETLARRRGQRRKNRELLESIQAVNDQGQEYTLQALSDLGVSNPEKRRLELMTRLAGFDQVAVRLGHAAEFYTITTPSKYHARDSKSGRENPNYQGATPRQAQKYLTKLWQRIRASFQRAGIRVYGFRVCEPHHDGTPHWHMVLFMKPEQVEGVRAIMRRYAMAEDGDEPGAAEHRFQAETIDRSKGTAAGYLAKYIAKNIDGYGVGEDWEAVAGQDDAARSAERVDAWASCWGIRQFQQIGGAPVTVWRELRRLEVDSLEDGRLKEIAAAADAGDWAAYNELNGGVMGARADRSVAAWRVGALDLETGELTINKYGELAAASILGVVCQELGEVKTRLREWVFKRSGAAVAAWSSVNNCTRSDDSGQEMAEHEPEKTAIPPFCGVDWEWRGKEEYARIGGAGRTADKCGANGGSWGGGVPGAGAGQGRNAGNGAPGRRLGAGS